MTRAALRGHTVAGVVVYVICLSMVAFTADAMKKSVAPQKRNTSRKGRFPTLTAVPQTFTQAKKLPVAITELINLAAEAARKQPAQYMKIKLTKSQGLNVKARFRDHTVIQPLLNELAKASLWKRSGLSGLPDYAKIEIEGSYLTLNVADGPIKLKYTSRIAKNGADLIAVTGEQSGQFETLNAELGKTKDRVSHRTKLADYRIVKVTENGKPREVRVRTGYDTEAFALVFNEKGAAERLTYVPDSEARQLDSRPGSSASFWDKNWVPFSLELEGKGPYMKIARARSLREKDHINQTENVYTSEITPMHVQKALERASLVDKTIKKRHPTADRSLFKPFKHALKAFLADSQTDVSTKAEASPDRVERSVTD